MSKLLHQSLVNHPRATGEAPRRGRRWPATSPRDMQIASLAIGCVCTELHVTRQDLESPLRTDHLFWARCLAINLIKNHTGMRIGVIGQLFNRTNWAVLYALDSLSDQLDVCHERSAQWDRISKLFSEQISKDQS